MNYMIALKGGFDNWPAKPQQEKTAVMQEFAAWAQNLMDKGHYQNCVRPDPEAECRRVQVRDGKMVVDGPFLETKELISGAFFVQAKDLQEATELGKSCPVLRFGGSVEVFALTEERNA